MESDENYCVILVIVLVADLTFPARDQVSLASRHARGGLLFGTNVEKEGQMMDRNPTSERTGPRSPLYPTDCSARLINDETRGTKDIPAVAACIESYRKL